jgi:outer membrane immunogenic protein
MMKTLLSTAMLASLLVAGAAQAADMPLKAAPRVAPPFSWTGCYIGGYVGGAWASKDVRATELTNNLGGGYNGVGNTWTYRLDSSFIGGGTLGCNWQVNQFVLGIEGEGGALSLRGSAPDPKSAGLDTVSHTKIGDGYGVIAGRLGVAFDRTLIYFKGGAAFVDVRSSVIDTCTLAPCGPDAVNATGHRDRTTWALGGGIEHALWGNWSVKAEYLFLDTNHSFIVSGLAKSGTIPRWDHDVSGVHTVKVGLNWRFGSPFGY